MKAREIQKLSNRLALLAQGGPTLSKFLELATGLHPEIDRALEGMYCGREGRIAEPCFDNTRTLAMGWYTVLDNAKCARVEYVYIG